MKSLGDYQLFIAGSTWLLTYAMHSVVAHAAALLSGRFIVTGPRLRSTLYRVALLLPLLTATAVTAGFRPFAPIAEINVAELARHRGGSVAAEVLVQQRVFRRVGVAPRIESFATDSYALYVALIALIAATIAALVGVLRQGQRYFAFRTRLGSRTNLAGGVGLRGARYQLTASPTIGAPVALGLREICVPCEAFDQLTADEQRSVLAHEVAHLARRDPVWFAISDALVALFPWQPLARLLARDARRAAEFCCDDAVVEAVGHGRALVRSLAAFAAGFDPAETAFAASCGGSPLEERARRLLASKCGEHRNGTAWAAALALVLLVAIVSVAPAISTRSRPEQFQHDRGMRRMMIEEVDTTR